MSIEEVCRPIESNLVGCPNLSALLRAENVQLLAYARFASRPLVLREFLHMLCPAADDREISVFEDWAREPERFRRPPSRSGLPLPPLLRPVEKDCGTPAAPPAAPSPRPSSAHIRSTLDESCTGAAKFRAIRGLPEKRKTSVEIPEEDVDKAQEQVKRYVQQRYLELMMVDGMEPNAACARALREAPTVLAGAQGIGRVQISAGLGSEQEDLATKKQYSARSVCA